MATSPWNKNALGMQKIAIPKSSEANRLPAPNSPIVLNLGGSELRYQDGVWIKEDKQGSYVPERSTRDSQESKLLRKENQELREQNNLLEFKVQLLIDMVAAANMDVKALNDTQQKLLKKLDYARN